MHICILNATVLIYVQLTFLNEDLCFKALYTADFILHWTQLLKLVQHFLVFFFLV